MKPRRYFVTQHYTLHERRTGEFKELSLCGIPYQQFTDKKVEKKNVKYTLCKKCFRKRKR